MTDKYIVFEDIEVVVCLRNTKQVKHFKYNELNKLTVDTVRPDGRLCRK